MAKKAPDTDLTLKAQKFIEAMADPDNESPTKAAIKAGYNPKYAHVEGNRLLKNAKIQDRIEKRKEEVAFYANITKAQVLGATALRAFATIDDAFDVQGHFDIQKARRTGAIHLIKKIARTKNKYGESVAVEFYSNESAQDKLGSYLGLDTLPAANPLTVEHALSSFHMWLEKNPVASVLQKLDAIKEFAVLGGVDEGELVQRAGIDPQQMEGVQ